MTMGRKKRSINRAKFGNYGRSSSYHSTDLRELAVENGWLLERQSILKKRRVIGE
jgi:hypothetical protein